MPPVWRRMSLWRDSSSRSRSSVSSHRSSIEGQRELAPVVAEMTVAEARRVIRRWRAQQRQEWAERPTPPLPTGVFRTLVIDPPLAYPADFGDGLAADRYKTMTLEELEALGVPELAAPDSHLYLWIGATRIPDGLRLISAWGFEFVALLTWKKPSIGLGTWWRYQTEHLIHARRGTLRTRPGLSNSVRSAAVAALCEAPGGVRAHRRGIAGSLSGDVRPRAARGLDGVGRRAGGPLGGRSGHFDERHIAPQVLEAVVRARLRREDVQHRVEVVGDDPGALALAVDRAREQALVVLQPVAHLVVDRRRLARVAAAAHDEEVGVDGHRPHVEDDDVLGELLAGQGRDLLC